MARLRTKTFWALVALLTIGLGALFTSTALVGCGEGDCLVQGENCSDAYLSANGKVGWQCCGDLSCHLGDISGVPICR